MTFDVAAPILPGLSAAGVSLGAPIDAILRTYSPDRVEPVIGGNLLYFGDVRLWVEDKAIMQVAVSGRHAGCLSGDIGIGSTLADAENALGPIFEDDEDNLMVIGLPGVSFETHTWRGIPGAEILADNMDARITDIYVFRPDAA
jgi:hypothetical protein